MLTESQRSLLKFKSLLGLLTDETNWDELEKSLVIKHAMIGEVIVHEGMASNDCFIPIDGEVELFTQVQNQNLSNGKVRSGRSINTYAFLRGQPYQYSARFKSEGFYCVLPMEAIQSRLKNAPELRTYLMAMTEDPELRRIAKDIGSLGGSSDFRIHFTSRLRRRSLTPNELVLQPGLLPTEAFFILDGQLVRQGVANEASFGKQANPQWQIPSRTWIGWNSLLEATPSTTIIRSTSNSTVFVFTQQDALDMQTRFPDEFAILSLSILSGFKVDSSVADDDEEAEQEVDLDELMQKTERPAWKSLPWVQQSDQMDCGPACMAMVSQFFGRKLSVHFWRNSVSTGRDGTSLYDLALAAEGNGFTAYSLDVPDIKSLDAGFFPAIALRRYHYVVIYEISATTVTVGDPAVGVMKLSHAEFADGFENAILFLKPSEKFFSIPESKSSYGHFWALLKGLEKEMALSFLASLMLVGVELFTPVLSQVFLDDILVRRDKEMLTIALVAGVLLAVVTGFLGWTRAYYANFLATKFDFNAHSYFVKKMMSLPYKFFADRHVGDFIRRVQEISKVKAFLIGSLESLVLAALSLVIYSTALFFYSPLIAVTVLTTAPIFLLLSLFSGKRLSRAYQSVFKGSAELDSNLTDAVKGMSTIKSLGAELASRWRYEEKLVWLLKAERKFGLTAAGLGVAGQFYSKLVNLMIMGLAAYLAIRGDLSPGQVVATTMIAGGVLTPLTTLANQIGLIQEVKAVCARLDDIFSAPSETTKKHGQLRKETLIGEIEFHDVWFRYGGEGSDWILKGVSFKIEAGQNVALVGPSGSGKSTIAALLARMFVPTKGQIFIDGRDYLDYDVSWLRTQIGLLHQETHLFHGSILSNIAYADPEPEIGSVHAAAEKAAAREFIDKKPNGFDYLISSGGLGLSVGEKQRVALARMFYRQPQILLLDEATSALDGIAEAKLLHNLREQTKDLTTINIAHRYSTVRYSDFALVMNEGRVVGFGTHDELWAENSVYQELFAAQFDVVGQAKKGSAA